MTMCVCYVQDPFHLTWPRSGTSGRENDRGCREEWGLDFPTGEGGHDMTMLLEY